MMLVDRGELELDLDPDVNDYLKDLEVPEAFGAPVTMRHLMTHTAGFEDTLAISTVPEDDPRTRAEVLAATRPDRVFPPGARPSYSNWGAELAAQVVADIAGMPYKQFLQREILGPLGMDSTTMALPGEMPPDLAERISAGHRRANGWFTTEDLRRPGPLGAAGAVASTASDMARWMRFHLNGGELDGVRLMSPQTHARMWTLSFDHPEAAPGMAHGFWRQPVGDIVRIGHGGVTAWFFSMMWLEPEQGIGVFASSNTGGDGVGERLANRIFARLTGMDSRALETGPTEAVDLAAYEGDYVTNRRSFTTLTRAGVRSVSLSVQAAPDEEGVLLARSGGEVRRLTAVPGVPDLFQDPDGQRFRFLRERGEVVSVVGAYGTTSSERVGGVDHPRTLNLTGSATVILAITTLLGFWRRWKHVPETTTDGRRAATAGVVSAVIVFVYVATLVAAMASVAGMAPNAGPEYPTPAVVAAAWSGWGVAAAAVLMLVGLFHAWRGSRWGWFRRLHYTAFALALTACAWLLWHWKFYGAPLV
jgi:CubicO group peptidase (beta-lactamase class C family)